MTNQRIVLTAILMCMVAVFFSSCQKDRLRPQEAESTQNSGSDRYWDRFNEFGPKLQAAFSYAVEDPTFSFQIVDLTQEMRTGDYEILLPEFLASEMRDGRSTREFFLEKSAGLFTVEELDDFMASYPSTLVAVRGNPASWLTTDYVAPVMFVPHGFDQQSPTIAAQRMGQRLTLDLTTRFKDAVVGIQMSERHDLAGNLILPQPHDVLAKTAQPNLGLDDVSSGPAIQALCNPEPSSCPSLLPTVNSFSATPENGGVKLEWNISDFPVNWCRWGRIRIKRYNPDGSFNIFASGADQPNFRMDPSGGPNVTYTYEIDCYIAYQDPTGTFPTNWTKCSANNNLLTATAVYPSTGPTVDSYRGINQSGSSIRYDWSAPTGAVINEYRIRRATNSGYVTLNSSLPPSTTSYFWNPIPSSFAGQMVETQIQYRAGGPWQGSFFDRSFVPYRNPNQPFKFYGIRIDDISDYDFDETNLAGAPEIRLTALQANAAETPIILTETFLPMTPCIRDSTIYLFPFNIPYTFTYSTGNYYPSGSPNGYTILGSWNSDLAGSAIRVRTLETDLNVVRVTEQTNTTTREENLSAKFGFKLLEENLGIDIGTESTWKNTTTEKILYPVDDLPISDNVVYYHENPTTIVGNQLFGNISFTDRCANLQNNL